MKQYLVCGRSFVSTAQLHTFMPGYEIGYEQVDVPFNAAGKTQGLPSHRAMST